MAEMTMRKQRSRLHSTLRTEPGKKFGLTSASSQLGTFLKWKVLPPAARAAQVFAMSCPVSSSEVVPLPSPFWQYKVVLMRAKPANYTVCHVYMEYKKTNRFLYLSFECSVPFCGDFETLHKNKA